MKSKAISTTKTKRKIIRITTRITLITAKETTMTMGEGRVVVVSVPVSRYAVCCASW